MQNVMRVAYDFLPAGCEAQLARKCLFVPTFFGEILTSKVGQTDLFLVYDQSLLIGLSFVHARLEVSLCSAYDLCRPG